MLIPVDRDQGVFFFPTLLFQLKGIESNKSLLSDYTRNGSLPADKQVLGFISARPMSHRRLKVVPWRSVQPSHAGYRDYCSTSIRIEEASDESKQEVRCHGLVHVWNHVRYPLPSCLGTVRSNTRQNLHGNNFCNCWLSTPRWEIR